MPSLIQSQPIESLALYKKSLYKIYQYCLYSMQTNIKQSKNIRSFEIFLAYSPEKEYQRTELLKLCIIN